MPPFKYDTPTNPYAGSIGDLLARKNDVAAQMALQQGQLTADTTRQNARVWSDAIQNIGQSVAAIPANNLKMRQMALQERAMNQEAQMNQFKLEDLKQQRAGQQAIAQALARTPKREDGTYDTQGFLSAVPDEYKGLAVGVVQHLEGVNQVFQKETQARRAQAVQGAVGLISSGSDPVLTLNFLDSLAASGQLPKASADHLRDQLAEDPSKAESILRIFVGPQKPMEVKSDTRLVDPLTNRVTLTAETKPPDSEADFARIAEDPNASAEQRTAAAAALSRLRAPKQLDPLEAQFKQAQIDEIKRKMSGAMSEKERADLDLRRRQIEGELAHWNRQDATAAAAKTDKGAGDIGDSVITTSNGRKYIDLSEFGGVAAKEDARKQATAQGIMVVDKQGAASLRAADTARSNVKSMLAQIEGELAASAGSRALVAPENLLSRYFQTDAKKGAFGSWRTAAIQTIQALAEPGMGLRLNRGEIDLALENDIPRLTDTVGVARQRVANLITMLDNKEREMLERDRSKPAEPTPAATPAAAPPTKMTPGLQSLMKR